ncbi:hypothetical protein [Streptomyces sp. NPDC051909]|uniref:hypothetical protein n=1 Tax=Streptomyces sp. NPDC051909 TaxID=3154944 RepID=UPI00343CC73C
MSTTHLPTPASDPRPAARPASEPARPWAAYGHRFVTAVLVLVVGGDLLHDHPGLREVTAALAGVVGAVAGVLALARRR